MPFMVQIWMFVSPVVYSANKVQGTWRTVYSLNPMGGWSRLPLRRPGPRPARLVDDRVGTVVSVVVLVSGMLYFRRVERTFADAI